MLGIQLLLITIKADSSELYMHLCLMLGQSKAVKNL